MRRAALATLAVVLLVLAAPHQPLASTRDDGIQPWGTWVWQTSFGPGMSMPALLTLHKDGTVSVSDGLMFGGLPGIHHAHVAASRRLGEHRPQADRGHQPVA